MTRKELEKEAEEYANNLAFVFETDVVQRIVRERVRLALIDVLEPREKRIAELEAQIEKMKSDVMGNIKWADQNKNEQMYCKLNAMFNQWEIRKSGNHKETSLDKSDIDRELRAQIARME